MTTYYCHGCGLIVSKSCRNCSPDMIRESVLSAVLSVPSKIKEIKQDTAMNENPVCFDCGAPYGVDGWCDVVIPNEIWNEIATDCGLLCFRCMTKRLLAAGKSGVPVIIASGPYVDANETWRQIGWDHGYAVCR